MSPGGAQTTNRTPQPLEELCPPELLADPGHHQEAEESLGHPHDLQDGNQACRFHLRPLELRLAAPDLRA